ncbi:hypothetical protein BST81_01680 [Leptolyngbya sp. 'hensonii']|nr:hypothetical protein BST81_01680 [Leptolyngbya sp. 'hensonii']
MRQFNGRSAPAVWNLLLPLIALVVAAWLSFQLAELGLEKFDLALAGGRKYATFPSWETHLGISLSYLLLWLLYLVWLSRRQRPSLGRPFRAVLRSITLFILLAFLAYPLGNDIYLYLHTGLMNLSDVNPFLVGTKHFTSELSSLVDWGQPSTYGPLSHLLFTGSAQLLAIHPLLAIYAFKGICLGLHLLNGYLLWSLLPVLEREAVVTAYLLNPLLLLEQVASGHIDVLVCTCTIVLIGCLQEQRYAAAFVALWAGFLTKTFPLLWMPLVGVWLIRHRRWLDLLWAAVFSVVLLVGLGSTVLPAPEAWRSLLNPGVAGQYQASLLALVRSALFWLGGSGFSMLTPALTKHLLLQLGQYSLLIYGLFYGWTLLQGLTKRSDRLPNLIAELGWVILTLFLFATPWLMPWYPSVLIPIAALVPQDRLFRLTTFTFCLSSSCTYLLLRHDGLKGLVVVGLPLLVLGLGSFLAPPQVSTSGTAQTQNV